jgi:neutral ceramidase
MGFGCEQVFADVINRRQPGKPVDTDLNVVSFQDEQGSLMAVLVNYTCHPVCLDHTNRLISADYPGYLTAELQEKTGAVVLFANGAAGDINPAQMGSFEYAENLGKALAAEAVRVLNNIQHQDEVELRTASQILALPLNPRPSIEELKEKIAAHRKLMLEADLKGDHTESKFQNAFIGWAEAAVSAASRGDLPTSVSAELQMFRLGQVVLAGVPGEIFSGLGMQMKSSSSVQKILVLGYTNNDIGYIPTRQAYELGGYEIDDAFKFYDYPAVLSPEAGEQIAAAAKQIEQSW